MASVQPTGASNGSDVHVRAQHQRRSKHSAPRKRVNDDPVNHNKWHWFGTLSVAPNGRIDAVWLDTRNAANNTDSQLFYSYSTDGGDTWSPNVAVSNRSIPFLGYPQQNKMGDYITIVSDNTGADVAYAATFNRRRRHLLCACRDLSLLNCSTSPPARTSSPMNRCSLLDLSLPGRLRNKY